MCRAASAARCAEESIEDLSKLGVEDGVDDRIEGAVDVAEPDEARQHQRVDATERRRATVRLVVADVLADADRVDDVDREERQPAEQKHGYINSALNPIIYTFFNAEFRQVFNRLLGTACRLSLIHI